MDGRADLRRDTPCPPGTPTGAGATASPRRGRGCGHLLTVGACRNPAPSRDAAAGLVVMCEYKKQVQQLGRRSVEVGVGFPVFCSNGTTHNRAWRFRNEIGAQASGDARALRHLVDAICTSFTMENSSKRPPSTLLIGAPYCLMMESHTGKQTWESLKWCGGIFLTPPFRAKPTNFDEKCNF